MTDSIRHHYPNLKEMMDSDDYKNLFTSSKLKSKLSSEQFKLSETLLDKRYELNLSFTEISKIVGIHEDRYIKYEYGNTDIPVECYQKAIKRIEEYKKHSLDYLVD